MKVSPTILSIAILPLATAWVVSAFCFSIGSDSTPDKNVHGFWIGIFFVGGPISLFIAAMLVVARWRPRTAYHTVDWIALGITAVGAIAFAAILLSMYMRKQRVALTSPKQAVQTTGFRRCSSIPCMKLEPLAK